MLKLPNARSHRGPNTSPPARKFLNWLWNCRQLHPSIYFHDCNHFRNSYTYQLLLTSSPLVNERKADLVERIVTIRRVQIIKRKRLRDCLPPSHLYSILESIVTYPSWLVDEEHWSKRVDEMHSGPTVRRMGHSGRFED